MCGIVGYIGKRDAYPVLIKGLRRLECRGYDSAGVALIDKKRRLNVYKTKGKVSDLEAFVSQKDVSGTIGIAHTRWATHGEPCSANAHPHFSSSENLALIHNGIIENYATLKEKLQKKGFIFKSSTDTEVLVQLIEYFRISNHLDLLTAVQLALHEVMDKSADNCIELRKTLECLEPFISTIPLQLSAYHVAVFKGKKCGSTTKSGEVGDCGIRMENSLDCFGKQSRDLQKTIKRPLTNSKEVFWGDTNKYMY